MDHGAVVEQVTRYAQAVAVEYPTVRLVVLFGSHVNGHATAESDIDVAVVVDDIPGDYLSLAAHLCTLRNGIDPLIEPHLLPRDSTDGFLAEVLRTGEVIYRAA
jgi:uncharacterized protein